MELLRSLRIEFRENFKKICSLGRTRCLGDFPQA